MKNVTKLASLASGWLAFAATSHAEFVVARTSDPTVVTHTVSSGALQLGLSSNGGGYIAQITLPTGTSIMGPASARYGRGGQSAIRDIVHSNKYNPTQAGFTGIAGTVCDIVTATGSAVIVARPACLFNGDGEYDFTRWENLASDGYETDGGNTDTDGLVEELANLPGKQAVEITSEFDYYGTYVDYKGRTTGNFVNGSDIINTPCIRHYFEYRYTRFPGHAISQHYNPTQYDSSITVNDIATSITGVQPFRKHDMGILKMHWALRIDRNWVPQYRWIVDATGNLQSEARNDQNVKWTSTYKAAQIARLQNAEVANLNATATQRMSLIILSPSANADTTGAIGIYLPATQVNQQSIVGYTASNDNITYLEDRRLMTTNWEQPVRTTDMQLFGFDVFHIGLMSPTSLQLEKGGTDNREKLRCEVYILYGSPNSILNNAKRISALSLN